MDLSYRVENEYTVKVRWWRRWRQKKKKKKDFRQKQKVHLRFYRQNMVHKIPHSLDYSSYLRDSDWQNVRYDKKYQK